MPHAYLFTGPEGVGRELMAMRLAQILHCSRPTETELPAGLSQPGEEGGSLHRGTDACGECDDCRLVRAGTHPDLFVIYRQLNREHPDSQIRKQKALQIGVDIIRHFIIDRVVRRPMRGRAKVFIIRDAERMTDAAQNSLLKTLEEPPPDTFLILLTSAMDRMLPTTKSRCQPVVFQTLPAAFVAERLAALRPEQSNEERHYVARHSGGSLGTAVRLIDDGLFAIKQAWGDRLLELVRSPRGFAPHSLAQPFLVDAKTIGKQAAERDPDISDTDATRAGIQALLAAMAAFYQDAQRLATGAAVEPTNVDQPHVIQTLSATPSPRRLVAALQQIAQADYAIGRNAAIELTMETMFIQLSAVAQGQAGLRIAS